jgi:hypothetical protein
MPTGRLSSCADGIGQLTAMLGSPSAAPSASGSCSQPTRPGGAPAAVVLALPRKWPAWLFAALVAGSAAAAVVAYTYIDIGPIAGLPNMYEPSWGPPGKLLSAVAEGLGALLALAGLGWALTMRRRAARAGSAAGAARTANSAGAARAAHEAPVIQASAEGEAAPRHRR